MYRHVRHLVVLVAVMALLAGIPLTATAEAPPLVAELTDDAELHDVIDADVFGFAVFRMIDDETIAFRMSADGFSGPVGAAHIHGPATAEETAGVLATLCGGPDPAAGSCTTHNGQMRGKGYITPDTLQADVEWEAFMDYLLAGLTYVNTHTELNGAGEARGQIYPTAGRGDGGGGDR